MHEKYVHLPFTYPFFELTEQVELMLKRVQRREIILHV